MSATTYRPSPDWDAYAQRVRDNDRMRRQWGEYPGWQQVCPVGSRNRVGDLEKKYPDLEWRIHGGYQARVRRPKYTPEPVISKVSVQTEDALRDIESGIPVLIIKERLVGMAVGKYTLTEEDVNYMLDVALTLHAENWRLGLYPT